MKNRNSVRNQIKKILGKMKKEELANHPKTSLLISKIPGLSSHSTLAPHCGDEPFIATNIQVSTKEHAIVIPKKKRKAEDLNNTTKRVKSETQTEEKTVQEDTLECSHKSLLFLRGQQRLDPKAKCHLFSQTSRRN
jgi:hypothetical protein